METTFENRFLTALGQTGLAESTGEHFSFGVFADVQFGQRAPQIGRDYRAAKGKTQSYLSAFQEQAVDFMVHMGDLIDEPAGSSFAMDSLQQMMLLLEKSGIPCIYLLGNHDSGSLPRSFLTEAWGFPRDSFCFSFGLGAFRFLILDSNYDKNGIPYEPETHTWDQCYVPPRQLSWLENELKAAKEPNVLILVHALLDENRGEHMVRNAHEVRELLNRSSKKITVLQGHKHTGDHSLCNGIHYHTLKATVEQTVDRYYWIVHADGSHMWAEIQDNDSRRGITLF